MTESRVVIAFGTDECAGDSPFCPHYCGHYFDGITYHDAKRMLVSVAEDCVFIDAITSDMTDDDVLIQYFNELPKGFWVVDIHLYEAVVNALEVNWFVTDDSIIYKQNQKIKEILKQASSDTILPPVDDKPYLTWAMLSNIINDLPEERQQDPVAVYVSELTKTTFVEQTDVKSSRTSSSNFEKDSIFLLLRHNNS